MIWPVYVSGARTVPRTIGSKYFDTEHLSGNWAGFTMVISSLPCSWNKNQDEENTVVGKWDLQIPSKGYSKKINIF